MSLSQGDYTVACICPMGLELAPVQAMLDRMHPSLPTQRDQNHYTLGEMCCEIRAHMDRAHMYLLLPLR
jgi:hypothetical protein